MTIKLTRRRLTAGLAALGIAAPVGGRARAQAADCSYERTGGGDRPWRVEAGIFENMDSDVRARVVFQSVERADGGGYRIGVGKAGVLSGAMSQELYFWSPAPGVFVIDRDGDPPAEAADDSGDSDWTLSAETDNQAPPQEHPLAPQDQGGHSVSFSLDGYDMQAIRKGETVMRFRGEDGAIKPVSLPDGFPAIWGEAEQRLAKMAADYYARSCAAIYVDDCFITTATCDVVGLRDDCWELRQLRAFRDRWAARSGRNTAAVAAYYDLAPRVLRRLARRADRDRILLSEYWRAIVPCAVLAMVRADAAVDRLYRAAVRRLQAYAGEG